MNLAIKRSIVAIVSTAVVAVLAVQPVVTGQTQTPVFVANAQEGPGDIDQGPEGPGDIDQPPRDDIDIPRPEPEFGAIKVIKFKDANGNGLEDLGEPRMRGVLFYLNMNSLGQRQATTNANGEILWTAVAVGGHSVYEIVPAGYVVTTPNPQNAQVYANQTVVLKFGNRPIFTPQQAKLEIVKLKDANMNGSCEKGEPAMAGVVFTIFKDGNVVATGTTNIAGLVEFDLDAGTYVALEQVPAGYKVLSQNPQTVVLVANDDKALLFCNQAIPEEPQKANILVIKFKDLNGNGKQDAGEPRLQGVEFTANGMMKKVTDANGEARWVELNLGSYKIVEIVPNGFRPTTPTEQTAVLDENGETVTLIFGNQPVELPPTGVFNVIVPGSLGVLATLYSMVRRQKRYQVELLRNL